MVRGCLLLVLVWMVTAANAVEVTGLYDAEVRVSGTDEQARDSGIQTGMGVVLTKLTGDRNAASYSGARELLSKANAFVQQYRYRTSLGEDGSTENWLWVQFDPTALSERLPQLGLPLWGPERLVTLVWLALEEQGQRHLLGSSEGSPVGAALARKAASRGIPLLLPLLDLEDQTRIDADGVWNDMADAVMGASERYRADAVLTAMIFRTDTGAWEARWRLYEDGGDQRWATSGQSVEEAAADGVDVLADTLAKQAAGSDLNPQAARLELIIDGVTDIGQYARVQRYLRSIAAVSDVQVLELGPQRLRLLVLAPGRTQAVKQAIALGDVLQPLSLEGREFRLNPSH